MTDAIDGAYYAIKGFLYQFDRALIEMLRNPSTAVAFENRQDVDFDDYVLQIKHKETQSYKPAKIRKAVCQLLSLFAATPSLKLLLYCYFNDRTPSDYGLKLNELDEILGIDACKYPEKTRRAFLMSFKIRFSEDYEGQFGILLSLIKGGFSMPTDEEAIIYHSLFRAHLLSRSILPKGKRRCSRAELATLRADSEEIVFYSAYSRYLGGGKYEGMLRKRFFTFSAPNIENYERLFILEPESCAARETVRECATRISRKYFRCGKSPQPYLCLRGLPVDFINEVKRSLLDQGVMFFDGTHFNGDRFRLDDLVRKRLNEPESCIKFVSESMLSDVISRVDFAEVFQIFVHSPVNLVPRGRHFCMTVSDLAQAVRIVS